MFSKMAMSVNAPAMLTRENYQTWVRQITRILECEGLKFWLNKNDWPDLESFSAIEKFRLGQSKQKAAGVIKSYCSPEIELLVGHMSDPAEIWSTLKDGLEIQGKGLKSFYLNEFRNLRPAPEEDFQTFIARYEESYRKVQDSGEVVPENHRCYHLIQSLPPEFDYLVRELESYDEEDFKYDRIKSEILKECFRRSIRKKIRCQLSTTAYDEARREPTRSRSEPERGARWHVIQLSSEFEDFPAKEVLPERGAECEEFPVEVSVPESQPLAVKEENESLAVKDEIEDQQQKYVLHPDFKEFPVETAEPEFPGLLLPADEVSSPTESEHWSGSNGVDEGDKKAFSRRYRPVKAKGKHARRLGVSMLMPEGPKRRSYNDIQVQSPVDYFAVLKFFLTTFFRILGCIHSVFSANVWLANVSGASDRSQVVCKPANYHLRNSESFVPKLKPTCGHLLLSGRYWSYKLMDKSLCRELCLRFIDLPVVSNFSAKNFCDNDVPFMKQSFLTRTVVLNCLT